MNPVLHVNGRSEQAILTYLDKTEEELEEYVELIRNWFKSQPHFSEIPSKNKIKFFLINNEFNIESTKEKLDAYFTLRTSLRHIFECSNPSTAEMKATISSAQILVLPTLLDNLYGVAVIKVRDYLPEELEAHWWLAAMLNAHEVKTEECILVNYVLIYDQQNFSLNHVMKITPLFLINCVKMAEKALGDRIRAVHFVNCPPYFQIIMGLCKTIMKPEFYDRLHLHSTTDSLTEYIPLDILPKDYGGNEKCLDELEELWIKKYEEYKDYFDKLDTLKVNEALRPNTDKGTEHFVFSPFDNFRKLFFES